MAVAAHEAIINQWIEKAWNQGQLDALEEMLDSHWVCHDPTIPDLSGIEAAKQLISLTRTAVPDLVVSVDILVSDGDKVVVRWTCNATHTGEWAGYAPTGKKATWTGTSIYRMAEGKIAEEWKNWDALGLYQHLDIVNLIPPPGKGAEGH